MARIPRSQVAVGALICAIVAVVGQVVGMEVQYRLTDRVSTAVFLAPFILAGIAIFLSLVAAYGITQSGGRLRGRGMAVAATLVALSTVPMLLVLRPARIEDGVPRPCSSNLHQIALFMHMYQNDSGGKFPDRLDRLIDGYGADPEIFVCPQDKHPMVTPTGLKTSFHYLSGLSPKTDDMVIIAYERRGVHEERRRVLQVDGHVDFLKEDEFHEELAKSLDLVKKQWDRYSPEQRAAIEAFYGDKLGP